MQIVLTQVMLSSLSLTSFLLYCLVKFGEIKDELLVQLLTIYCQGDPWQLLSDCTQNI